MRAKPPVDALALFAPERAALLALLSSLDDEDWQAPTVCEGWSVKDVAAHLAGDDLGALSWGRDGHSGGFFDPASFEDLVAFINRHNEAWVETMRRLSPGVIMDLLRWTGPQVHSYYASLPPDQPGVPVDWAGPGPAPNWLHVGREYTERWLHQQQIRDAVGRAGLYDRGLFHPVLDTFVHALPRAYAGHEAPEGTHVAFSASGDGGGTWSLVRQGEGWGLFDDVASEPVVTVTLSQQVAWRLLTKGIDAREARAAASIVGDAALAEPLFDAVAILA